ncbi:hypothetical protein OUZ56_009301 [Daphnia magna]|uniref:Uncharacterized protein n=1 Tax=Daphnia magna TaxID=35525 RepID=A0ABR0AFZ4_9CRUS|nr:hypothetical protein OUZ56_009301 [Daphnia magna]
MSFLAHFDKMLFDLTPLDVSSIIHIYNQARGGIMSHLLVDFREGRTSSVRAIDWNTTRGESSSSVKLKWNYSTTHEIEVRLLTTPDTTRSHINAFCKVSHLVLLLLLSHLLRIS